MKTPAGTPTVLVIDDDVRAATKACSNRRAYVLRSSGGRRISNADSGPDDYTVEEHTGNLGFPLRGRCDDQREWWGALV
jgi:hypothetical protein